MKDVVTRRIVVGVDDSSGGLSALRWAVRQARVSRSQLVAVRSWALGLPRRGGRRHRRKRHSAVVVPAGCAAGPVAGSARPGDRRAECRQPVRGQS